MKNKSGLSIKKEIETVLNEIRCLARIKNENVVRYNHSWIEVVLKKNAIAVKEQDEEEEEDEGLEKDNSFVLEYFDDEEEKGKKKILEEKEEKQICNNYKYSCDNDNNDNSEFDYNFSNSHYFADQYVKFEENNSNSRQGVGHLNRNLRVHNNKLSNSNNVKEHKNKSNDNYNYNHNNNNFNNNNFDNSLNQINNTINPPHLATSPSNLRKRTRDSYFEEVIKINKDSYKLKDIKKMKIFIQMELCKETLGDVLHLRNSSCNNILSTDETINYLTIFLQFAEAIEYLHEKEKLIHRDLKPNNIFLTDSRSVKIGDLGLATDVLNIKYKKFSMDTDVSLSRKGSELSEHSTNNSDLSYHTKNVGTVQYASPEQLNNNYYDQKADVYSMGLILFETVYPIKTGMERHTVFKDLKERGVININNNNTNLSSLILEMVNQSPSKRPGSKEVVIRIKEVIDKIKNEMDNNNNLKRKRAIERGIGNTRDNKIEEIIINNLKNEVLIKIFDEGVSEIENSSNINYQKFFVKIISSKLLIYENKKANKALYVYDLLECQINIKSEAIELDHSFMNKLHIKRAACN